MHIFRLAHGQVIRVELWKVAGMNWRRDKQKYKSALMAYSVFPVLLTGVGTVFNRCALNSGRVEQIDSTIESYIFVVMMDRGCDSDCNLS